MDKITQILILSISIAISNGLPYFLNLHRPMSSHYGLPYLCGNPFHQNFGQAFLCNYYNGLQNSPRLKYGYRFNPRAYERFTDSASDEEFSVDSDTKKNYDLDSIEGDINYPYSNIRLISINNNANKKEPNDKRAISSELNVKNKHKNDGDSEYEKENIFGKSAQDGNNDRDIGSNIVFPEDIDVAIKKLRTQNQFQKHHGQDISLPTNKEQSYSDVVNDKNNKFLNNLPKINLIPNNQPVRPNNNEEFSVPHNGNNGITLIKLPKINYPSNSFSPVYISNSASPGLVNQDSNLDLNSKHPTYYEVPLNNVPIILVPNEDVQTIVSNTRQVIILGNGQNIPFPPNPIFILNNGQKLQPSNDQILESSNNKNIPQVIDQKPASNNNQLSQGNDNYILQDNDKNLPRNENKQSDDSPQITNQDLPKTNGQLLLTDNVQDTSPEHISFGIPSNDQQLPRKEDDRQNLTQDNKQNLSQDEY